jgi:Flp pilus assembly protein protease CpaA
VIKVGYLGIIGFEVIPFFAFFVILGYISLVDLKCRMIPYWTVPVLFLFAGLYIYIGNLNTIIASVSCVIATTTFFVLFIFARGGFGIGDVMVMSAIGWLIADTSGVYTYMLYILMPIGALWVVGSMTYHYKKFGKQKVRDLMKFKKTIPVEELQVGMVLEGDNFMNGLTKEQISDIQQKQETVSIKQPISFIPVPFISLVIYYALLFSGLV